jgi:membrane protein DedA with SNARE-associated domain
MTGTVDLFDRDCPFYSHYQNFRPVVAGVGAMPYKRFLAFNVFGNLLVMATTLAAIFWAHSFRIFRSKFIL